MPNRFHPIPILALILCTTAFAQSTRPSGGFGLTRGQPPAVPLLPTTQAAVRGGTIHNVTLYGAAGDGKQIDSDAINRAIDAASADGGGTVYFPAGTYLCFSIHLKSNITLQLDQGARILAAAAGTDSRGYDAPEPNPQAGNYQDAGHSHWHDALIWGDSLSNIAIVGPGIIDGTGLGVADYGARGGFGRGQRGGFGAGASTRPSATSQPARPQAGNKALSLKLCRNVTLRDVTFYRGGHFCILATGVDNMIASNLTFDTDRDSFDIDACRNVRISDCSINSPNDDGLVLKSSFALGAVRPCENISITNCLLSGYEIGSLLDGTCKPLNRRVPDGFGPTGRIKIGTETIGPFRNIAISNCIFDHSRGLAIESVDGSTIEDITVNNITMRDTTNSPIFLRLGARLHAPASTAPGAIRRVNISNVVVDGADPHSACIIAGIPGLPIEDVHLSNIRIQYQGGWPKSVAMPSPPEDPRGYPEPARLGEMPAYGFFIRHAKGIEMSNVSVSYAADDARPPYVLDDVSGVDFDHVRGLRAPGAPAFLISGVGGFEPRDCDGPVQVKASAATKTAE